MKIVMIDHFSSTNQYTVELVEELSKLAEVILLTVNDSTISGSKRYKYKKILYGHVDGVMLKRKFKYLWSLIRFVITVIKERPDVIHIQTFRNYRVELPIYRLLRRITKKMVITAHNVAPHEQVNDKSPYIDIYNLCDAIVVHNNVCKEILVNDNQVSEEKIKVIPHGTYNMFKTEYQQKKNTDIIEFIQFGLIRKYKGIKTLIEAINLLPEDYKMKAHFTIAGRQDKRLDDTDYDGLIEKYNLKNIITFIPIRISDEDMIRMFLEADVCTCPYINIYGSGALLMAYTFELPVIASDIPAFREETENGKTGYLFKAKDSNDMCRQIKKFLDADNGEIQEKKNNIKRLIENKYSWSSSAKKTYSLYEIIE